jgi:desulfoferrodoxin (superoxide reductase-like protein)
MRLVFHYFAILWVLIIIAGCNKSREEDNQKQKVPQPEYTRENPGEWEGMENEHLPKIEVLPNESKDNVIVTVALKNPSETHYVERIGVMDAERKDIAGQSFTRNAHGYRAVLTVYPLHENSNFKVYVKCNLHDLWTMRLPAK